MANYCCATRTNYFRVKDPDRFKEIMNKVVCAEDSISVWQEEKNGKMYFGFGCYSSILGIEDGDPDDCDCDYDLMVDMLSEVVADDDAIIIMESGNEKLRYVIGQATVITSTAAQCIDLTDIAMDTACSLLENPLFTTQMAY